MTMNETINVICGNCRREGVVSAVHAGRRGRCRKCGAGLVVPMPATAEVHLPLILFEAGTDSVTAWEMPAVSSSVHVEPR